jgi:ABC-type transporter Mla subunit MlaD
LGVAQLECFVKEFPAALLASASARVDRVSKEFNIGLTVVCLLTVLLVVGLQKQDTRPDPFSPRYNLLFTHVSGLRPGDPVTVAGVQAGFIEKIDFASEEERRQFERDGLQPQVKVTVTFNRKVRLTEGARYQQRSNLKGYRWIEVMLTGEGQPLASQSTISGEQPASNEDQLTKTLKTFKKLNVQTAEMRDLVEDEEFRRNVKDMASNMRFYSREFARTSESANESLQSIDRALSEQEAKLHGQISRIDAQVGRVRERLVSMTPQVRESLDSYRSRIHRSSGELATLLKKVVRYSEQAEQVVDEISKRYHDTVVPEKIIATVREYSRKLEDMALLAEDMHTLSSDPQVQADLRKMVSDLRARSEKLKSDVERWEKLLDEFGL